MEAPKPCVARRRRGHVRFPAACRRSPLGLLVAIAAAIKGYRCIFTMPDKMSQEKIALLRAYGAEVVITPTSVPPDSPESYYRVADRLTEEIPGAFQPNQYFNPENPRAHEATTGPEIWRQTDGRITAFVTNPDLPATNNEAERALRDAVIARRISNGTRSEEGSAAYAATLSVFETCRRRGVEPWRYITDLLARARKGLPHLTIPLSA